MTDSRRSARARAHLAERDPALGMLSLWCAHRDHSGATETDGATIRYAPGFDTLPLPQQVGLVAHHVLHVALRHSDRAAGMRARLGGAFDAELFGMATDAIVNETLLAAGHAIPRPGVTLTGLVRSAGLGPAGADPAALELLTEWDTNRLYSALIRDESTRRAARKHGAENGFSVDVVEARAGDVSPEDDATWQARLARAAEEGEGAGAGLGPVLARLSGLDAPRVPWERELRRLITRATLPEPQHSWARPARRWIAQLGAGKAPPFQPALARHRPAGRVVVALDTSSSVTDDQWALLTAELRGILRRSGASCHLLAFDDAVHHDAPLDAGLTRPDLRRGGGTDFAPVMARAAALDPSILVMLTDADAPMPPVPRVPVIWAVPRAPDPAPPFGRVIEMV